MLPGSGEGVVLEISARRIGAPFPARDDETRLTGP